MIYGKETQNRHLYIAPPNKTDILRLDKRKKNKVPQKTDSKIFTIYEKDSKSGDESENKLAS
jgi:hypothetical protein